MSGITTPEAGEREHIMARTPKPVRRQRKGLARRLPDDKIKLISIELSNSLTQETWKRWFSKLSELDFLEATMRVWEHPEGWVYACFCRECQSYAD